MATKLYKNEIRVKAPFLAIKCLDSHIVSPVACMDMRPYTKSHDLLPRITGPLVVCKSGYHLTSWSTVFMHSSFDSVLFLVEVPLGARLKFGSSNKFMVDTFRFIKRIKRPIT